MAAGAKAIQSRLDDWFPKEQEEQRRLLGFADTTREDAQNLVAQATSRIYHLRNRLVVAGISEGGRRKKAAKTQDEPPSITAAAGPSFEQQREPAEADPPSQPLDTQSQPDNVHAADQLESGRGSPQEVAAGMKRGRAVARSAVSVKRPKAQQLQPADGGASRPPPYASGSAAAVPATAEAYTVAQAEVAPVPQQAEPVDAVPRRMTRRAAKDKQHQSQPAEAPPVAPARLHGRRKKQQEAHQEETGVGPSPLDTSETVTAPILDDGGGPLLLQPQAPVGLGVVDDPAEAGGHAEGGRKVQDLQSGRSQEMVDRGASPLHEAATSAVPDNGMQEPALRPDERSQEASPAGLPVASVAPDLQQPGTIREAQAGQTASLSPAQEAAVRHADGILRQQHPRPADAPPAATSCPATQSMEVATDASQAADAQLEASAPAAEALQAKAMEHDDGQVMSTGTGAQPAEAKPAKSSPHAPKGGRKQRKLPRTDCDTGDRPKEPPAAASAPSARGGKKQRQDDALPAPGPSGESAGEAAPMTSVPASRVTRSKRGQPAGADAAAAAPPSVSVPKPVRTRGTRQKRDMQDAQLCSPGLHPKTKQAVEDDRARTASEPLAAEHAAGRSGAAQDQEQQPQEQTAPPSVACPPISFTLDVIPPPPGPPPPPPPFASNRFARMPTAIAATVAMLGGKPVASSSVAPISSDGPSVPAAQVAVSEPWDIKAPKARCSVTEPDAVMQGAAGGSGRGSREELSDKPSGDDATFTIGDVFCFGTKAKEQSSPDMPHFGQPAEQGPLVGRSTCTPPDGKADVLSPLIVQLPLLAAAPGEAGTSAEPVARLSEVQDAPDASGHEPEAAIDDAVPSAVAKETAKVVTDAAGAASAVGEAAGGTARADLRHRSLSLSVSIQPGRLSTHDPTVGPQQPVASPLASEAGTPGRHAMGFDGEDDQQGGPAQDDAAAAVDIGDGVCAEGTVESELDAAPSAIDPPSVGRFIDRRLGNDPETEPAGGNEGRAVEADACDVAMQSDEAGTPRGGLDVSAAPASASDDQSVVSQPPGGSQKPAAVVSSLGETAQPNKPKGTNLVSCVRSFLPARVVPSPPLAAGKKVVKVKALEAAQAAKQKEAARAAERAQARAAAADRHKQVQLEATAGNGVGIPKPTPAKSKPVVAGASIARGTPPGTAARPEVDTVPVSACRYTEAAMPPTGPAATANTTTADDRRNDGMAGGTTALGSVKARAAFFQEQAKRAEQSSVRRPTGTAAVGAVPSYKPGAAVRGALATGDGDAALVTTTSAVPAVNTAAAGAAANRAAAAGAASAAVETVADKHKRVEAKRREEEERRRAELEARTKAKDDKLRNLEVAKQQQRLGGGGAGALRPIQSALNPLAVCPPGKRQLPNGGAGPSTVIVKPEPESCRPGPVGPSAARTPGAKAGPNVGGMVSPAVQMQIKLLPAVHPQNSSTTGAQGNSAAKPYGAPVPAGVPGLPKPQPPKPQPQSQRKGQQPSAGRFSQPGAARAAAATPGAGAAEVTPGAGDLTEEERRNVHAIQTSPYIAQVKPRTPGVTTATKSAVKKPFTNYEISPYRSDSDDDIGDDEDDSPRNRRKPLPDWAAASKVLEALQAQQAMDADAIFGKCPKTIDIIKVFSDMPPPGLTDARGRPRRDYRRRGSSGNWEGDELP